VARSFTVSLIPCHFFAPVRDVVLSITQYHPTSLPFIPILLRKVVVLQVPFHILSKSQEVLAARLQAGQSFHDKTPALHICRQTGFSKPRLGQQQGPSRRSYIFLYNITAHLSRAPPLARLPHRTASWPPMAKNPGKRCLCQFFNLFTSKVPDEFKVDPTDMNLSEANLSDLPNLPLSR